MPRRYHRPPAAKRRKARRAGQAPTFEETQPTNGDVAGAQPAEELYEDEVDEALEEDVVAVPVTTAAGRPAAEKDPYRHIQRDYSYVRSELLRIAAVAGFLLIALIITSIFR